MCDQDDSPLLAHLLDIVWIDGRLKLQLTLLSIAFLVGVRAAMHGGVLVAQDRLR